VLNYIGASQSTETIGGFPYIITSENNTRGGQIAGVETTFQTRFFFLPGVLSDFGVYVNHAYAESNIHESTPQPNPFPMVGLATSTTEADLFFNKAGFESRVAVKNHSAFTVAPTWVGTTLKILEPETTLDASARASTPTTTRRIWRTTAVTRSTVDRTCSTSRSGSSDSRKKYWRSDVRSAHRGQTGSRGRCRHCAG